MALSLLDIVRRPPIAEDPDLPAKIPWNDPSFSERMLAAHLDQAHDAASRRYEIVDGHVAFLDALLAGPSDVLDLGCGPGFYVQRLARLGHRCVGIDFAPAAVHYARATLGEEGLDAVIREGDVTRVDLGGPFDLVMLIYGEFNAFTRTEAADLLQRANAALRSGGRIVLEPHTHEGIESIGTTPPSWYSSEGGLFSPRPHLTLVEHHWDGDALEAHARFYVVDAVTGEVTRYGNRLHGYREDDYRDLLRRAGFEAIEVLPGLGVDAGPSLCAVVARKP